MIAVAYENLPQELKQREQWTNYQLRHRNGDPKVTKVPVNGATGELTSTMDRTTWISFAAAERAAAAEGVDGIGFVFTGDDPYTGVDLDGVRDPETGELEPAARAIIASLDSYTEISQSGTGVHTIVRGALPAGRRRKGKTEVYDAKRYFVMTGKRAAMDANHHRATRQGTR